MELKKCDRCGCFFSLRHTGILRIRPSFSYTVTKHSCAGTVHEKLNLCEICQEELIIFILKGSVANSCEKQQRILNREKNYELSGDGDKN